MNQIEILTVVGFFLAAHVALKSLRTRLSPAERLETLIEHSSTEPNHSQSINWKETEHAITALGDRLGKAGFITSKQRQDAKTISALVVGIFTLLGLTIGSRNGLSLGTFIGCFSGAYLGFLVWLFYLRFQAADLEREIMFRLPLLLESLILLVDAGLGVLPALERITFQSAQSKEKNPVAMYLGRVYQLAASGMPLAEALQVVADATGHRTLRHVLLHLDLSGTEGGELIPALKSLSDYVHTEWKLSVEQRVKRLENGVVFPVFVSVIGLLMLVSAVPLVPLLEFRDLVAQTPQEP